MTTEPSPKIISPPEIKHVAATWVAQRTKGDGDCALHAIFGEPDSNGVYVCTDVVTRRHTLRERVAECKPGSDVHRYAVQGIKELILSRHSIGVESDKLLAKHQEFLQHQSKLSPQLWEQFEKTLPQYPDIMAYINAHHRHPKGASASLRDKFYDALTREEGTLYGLIRSLPALHNAFKLYNELDKTDIDWDSATPALLKEYAAFIGKPTQWLLASEVALIAHVFGITIDYYRHPATEAEPLNPGQPEAVAIRFNGRNHFERLTRTVVTEQKLPAPVASDSASAFSSASSSAFVSPSGSVNSSQGITSPFTTTTTNLVLPGSIQSGPVSNTSVRYPLLRTGLQAAYGDRNTLQMPLSDHPFPVEEVSLTINPKSAHVIKERELTAPIDKDEKKMDIKSSKERLKESYKEIYKEISSVRSVGNFTVGKIVEHFILEDAKGSRFPKNLDKYLVLDKPGNIILQDSCGLAVNFLSYYLASLWSENQIFNKYDLVVIVPTGQLHKLGKLDFSEKEGLVKKLYQECTGYSIDFLPKKTLLIIDGYNDKFFLRQKKTKRLVENIIQEKWQYILIAESKLKPELIKKIQINEEFYVSLLPPLLKIETDKKKVFEINGKNIKKIADQATNLMFSFDEKCTGIDSICDAKKQIITNESMRKKESKENVTLYKKSNFQSHHYRECQVLEFNQLDNIVSNAGGSIHPSESKQKSTTLANPSQWYTAAVTSKTGKPESIGDAEENYRFFSYNIAGRLIVRNAENNYFSDFGNVEKLHDRLYRLVSQLLNKNITEKFLLSLKECLQEENQRGKDISNLFIYMKKEDSEKIDNEFRKFSHEVLTFLKENKKEGHNNERLDPPYSKLQEEMLKNYYPDGSNIENVNKELTQDIRKFMNGGYAKKAFLSVMMAALMIAETGRNSTSFIATLCLMDLIELNSDGYSWNKALCHPSIPPDKKGELGKFASSIKIDRLAVLGGDHPMVQDQSYWQTQLKPEHGVTWVDFKTGVIFLDWLRESFIRSKPIINITNCSFISEKASKDSSKERELEVFDRFFYRLSNFNLAQEKNFYAVNSYTHRLEVIPKVDKIGRKIFTPKSLTLYYNIIYIPIIDPSNLENFLLKIMCKFNSLQEGRHQVHKEKFIHSNDLLEQNIIFYYEDDALLVQVVNLPTLCSAASQKLKEALEAENFLQAYSSLYTALKIYNVMCADDDPVLYFDRGYISSIFSLLQYEQHDFLHWRKKALKDHDILLNTDIDNECIKGIKPLAKKFKEFLNGIYLKNSSSINTILQFSSDCSSGQSIDSSFSGSSSPPSSSGSSSSSFSALGVAKNMNLAGVVNSHLDLERRKLSDQEQEALYKALYNDEIHDKEVRQIQSPSATR